MTIWPQITLIVLIAVGATVNLAEHGKPRANRSFWRYLVRASVVLWLLYSGGFFAPLGWHP